MDSMDWDTYFFFNPKDPRSKCCVGRYNGMVRDLNFEIRCSSLDASLIQWWVPTLPFFFRDFF